MKVLYLKMEEERYCVSRGDRGVDGTSLVEEFEEERRGAVEDTSKGGGVVASREGALGRWQTADIRAVHPFPSFGVDTQFCKTLSPAVLSCVSKIVSSPTV